MSYVTRLIGNIDPGIEDGLGNLVLPEIVIANDNIQDPSTLKRNFGLVGQGLEKIVGNRHLNEILQRNGDEIKLVDGSIQGLKNISEPEQAVLQYLFSHQLARSHMLYKLASNKELQNYDRVTKGVFQGAGMGTAVGASLNIIQWLLHEGGIPELTEQYLGSWANDVGRVAAGLAARALPGMAEAVGIKQQVIVKDA